MDALKWAESRMAELSAQLTSAAEKRDFALRVKMECEHALRTLDGAEREIADMAALGEDWAKQAAEADGRDLEQERSAVLAKLREATAVLEQSTAQVLHLQGRRNVVASHAGPRAVEQPPEETESLADEPVAQ